MQSFGVNGFCDCDPFPEYLGVRLNLDVTAQWSPTASIVHQFSPGLLRQGETFSIVSTLTPGSGALDITYTLSGDVGQYDSATWPANGSEMNVVPFSFSTSGAGTCALKLDGDGNYSCSATKVVTIYEGELFGIAGIKVTLRSRPP